MIPRLSVVGQRAQDRTAAMWPWRPWAVFLFLFLVFVAAVAILRYDQGRLKVRYADARAPELPAAPRGSPATAVAGGGSAVRPREVPPAPPGNLAPPNPMRPAEAAADAISEEVPVLFQMSENADHTLRVMLRNESTHVLTAKVTAVNAVSGSTSTVDVTVEAERRKNLTDLGLVVGPHDHVTIQSGGYKDQSFDLY